MGVVVLTVNSVSKPTTIEVGGHCGRVEDVTINVLSNKP